LFVQGEDWHSETANGRLRYCDAQGTLDLPLPALPGAHQADNAALAIAMLRHQCVLEVPDQALARANTEVRWPARLQKLGPGPLVGTRDAWLDGGHNPQAAQALAASMPTLMQGRPLNLIAGVLTTKDAAGLLAPFLGLATRVHAIAFDHPLAMRPEQLGEVASALGLDASPCANLQAAIAEVPPDAALLIAGSLYLAGEVLAFNDELPD
jgi:dihydrofolate synthase/folylpolyglutamate synthase